MEIKGELLRKLLPTTSLPKRQISSDAIAPIIEKDGWLRSIAGDSDFGKACAGIAQAYSSGRGVMLFGSAGVGKTSLMKILFTHAGLREKSWLSCHDNIHLGWMRNNPEHYYDRDVFVDDLGSESVKLEYGNRIDIVGDFIQSYYERGHGRMFISTNLMPSRFARDQNGIEYDRFKHDQLNEIYGGRVFDRLLEMCVWIKFDGKSKRERMVVK